jgi:hypothetical protein
MRWRRKPVCGRSLGSATHNRATGPGKFEVTVWGWSAHRRREVAVILDEESAKRLADNLGRFGFYPS